MGTEATNDLLRLLPARTGHFLLESGHHGDLALDLELLFLEPERIRPLAIQLADALVPHNVEVVCGPLVEGAFVALMVASQLGVPFAYSERKERVQVEGLFPFKYMIPPRLRAEVTGHRVAIINDVINAGSAVKATFADLHDCAAQPVALATLAVLGEPAAEFAAQTNMELITLARIPNCIWAPSECPLCADSVPLA